MAERVNIDHDLASSDWIRSRTWDLYVRSGDTLVPVTTVEQFLSVLGDTGLTPDAFMTLPAAAAMPDDLREALEEAGIITS